MSSENNLLPFVKPIPVDKIPINNNPSAASTLIFADEQLNPRRVSIQYFNEKIASGVTGTIKTQQTLPELNALPDGVYRASTSGPYANGLTVAKGVLTLFKKVGTVWTVDTEVLMPNSTTPTWEPKEYEIGSQVFYDWSLYEAIKDTLTTEIPDVPNSTAWKLILKASGKKVGGQNLYEITDVDGRILAAWDASGNLWASYNDESILPTAVEGLPKLMSGIKSASTVNLYEFRDLDDKIVGTVDRSGTLRINNIITDSLELTGAVKNPVTNLTNVVLPEQHFLRVNFIGMLPWDATVTRTPVTGVLEFFDRYDNLLIRLNTKMSIQGQSSAGDVKKGYSVDFMNANGEDVFIKFGDFPTVKGMHMKAFLRDGAHVRDIGGGMLWEQVIRSRPYPSNQFKIPYPDMGGRPPYNSYAFHADAKFSLQGIPIQFDVGGKFYGLYTLRQKKGVENYAMSNKNQNHIFLDSTAENGVPVGLGNQNYADFAAMNVAYELRSPKSPNETTKANCMRFFNYFKGVYNGDNDLKSTYAPYMDYIDWIDWLINAEVLLHWDSVNNNASYFSYDGKKWKPGMHDLEFTAANFENRDPNRMYIAADIWPKIRTTFATEIKARYTELRRTGVYSNANIVKIYGGIAKYIPMDVWDKNAAIWGEAQANANPYGYQLGLDGIYSWFSQRFAYLDTVWLNP
ncbi:CotH kinase family protein [Elizabethkingia anophelis]|nr:CotH kinase family protein [Elizabethkingia anophelis]